MAEPFIRITGNGLSVLEQYLKDTPKEIPKQTVIVLNQTAKDHKRDISKQVRTMVAINAKGANEVLGIRRATKGKMVATVIVKPGFRPSLKRFSAKQTRAGVSYKIDKNNGRKTIPGAFGPNINRLGNHVYKRDGKKLRKLRGVSPWGVYTKNNLSAWTEKQVQEALQKRIQRRIRALYFRALKKAKKT